MQRIYSFRIDITGHKQYLCTCLLYTSQFNKALSMDKSHTEIYKDISDVYEKKRDFPKAIEAYKNCIRKFEKILLNLL